MLVKILSTTSKVSLISYRLNCPFGLKLKMILKRMKKKYWCETISVISFCVVHVPGTESHILVVVDQVDVDFDDGEESLSECVADRLLVLDVRAGVQRDLFIYQLEK